MKIDCKKIMGTTVSAVIRELESLLTGYTFDQMEALATYIVYEDPSEVDVEEVLAARN